MSDLYFIRMGAGPVKIGQTVNIKDRMSCFQVGSPYPLDLLALIADAGVDEPLWHEHFASDRLCGEWFEWSERLEAAIARVKEVCNSREALGLPEWGPPSGWGKSWNLPALETAKANKAAHPTRENDDAYTKRRCA